MAEGFARRYGSDVLQPLSAGISPAAIVQPLTIKVMADKNIDIEKQYPKHLTALDPDRYDMIVNMSGVKLPGPFRFEVREWSVQDPIGESEDVYIAVRDRIEFLVMHLILEFRRATRQPAQPKSTRNLA